jgi:hypothetical protein
VTTIAVRLRALVASHVIFAAECADGMDVMSSTQERTYGDGRESGSAGDPFGTKDAIEASRDVFSFSDTRLTS